MCTKGTGFASIRLVSPDYFLTIPEDEQPRLLRLATLEDAAFDELMDALSAAPLKFRTNELVQAVTPLAGKHLSPEDAKAAVETLREMAMFRAMAEVDLDEFVKDVLGGMQAALSEKFTDGARVKLAERLSKLLSLQSISAPSKARSLLIDHAQYLCRARIFTDVRPVFGSDVEQTPATALVVHTLKLSYHQGSSVRDFFVVLDRRDLDELSDLLDRAKRKENSLQAMLGSAGIEPLQTN